MPTLTSAPGDDPATYTYEVPKYQLDGSYSPFSYTDQPLVWIPGNMEDRYFDMATSTMWDQANLLGMLQIQAFASPLMADGTTYSDAVAVVASVLLSPGGFTLFGLEYDSAHELVNVLGPGAAELFSVPMDLGYGASLDDVPADSAAAVNPLEPGDIFGWLQIHRFAECVTIVWRRPGLDTLGRRRTSLRHAPPAG